MTEDQNKITALIDRLEMLSRQHDSFQREIVTLRSELFKLQNELSRNTTARPTDPFQSSPPPLAETPVVNREVNDGAKPPIKEVEAIQTPITSTDAPNTQRVGDTAPHYNYTSRRDTGRSSLEKFIGENLINKIGIAITVIGVAIGAKYAIDHDMISPLTRIVLGYLFGVGLLGVAMRLRKKYEDFSAVLLSGSMAIMYFITFAAYSFYGLLPQAVAFGIMVVFTAFTVFAAIRYDRQVIAHIGLVGAYAVPFLLSDGSGRVQVLFSYMAIINAGILVVAFRRYWKPLYYASFGLTWLIFLAWYATGYKAFEHFGLALLFSTLFFVIFYAAFLVYKLNRKENFDAGDIVLLLFNSFIYYGVGYTLLDGHSYYRELLGAFTLANALVHFGVSVVIYRNKLADRNLFFLVSGLVLVFITVAVPVQFDGNWVTMIWVAEAALLFWIGRTKQVPVYETLSYPLMLLAFVSLLHDWQMAALRYKAVNGAPFAPLLNIEFFTSMFVVAGFAFIAFINANKRYPKPFTDDNPLQQIVAYGIPAVLVVSLYLAFSNQIHLYWELEFLGSTRTVNPNTDNAYQLMNYDLPQHRTMWQLNYTMLFVGLLALVNLRWLKDRILGLVTMVLIALVGLAFLTQGLPTLAALRDSFIYPDETDKYYLRTSWNVGLRYVSLAFFGMLLWLLYLHVKANFARTDLRVAYESMSATVLLVLITAEYFNVTTLLGSDTAYKFSLSLLWGVYALVVIGIGIWLKKKHLRIGAMGLLAVTIAKLFLYDISHLSTIFKTIVMVALGLVLLVVSFLYNKYKHLIADEPRS